MCVIVVFVCERELCVILNLPPWFLRQYRLKPWKIRQNNDSAKRYYTQKKAVQKEFEDLLLDENTGGF